MTEGRVESTKVSAFAEQSLAELAYSYRVADERYSGYFTRQFADEQDAWDYVRPLQKQSIFVRYRPDDPAVSAVRSDDQSPLLHAKQGNFWVRFFTKSVARHFGIPEWKSIIGLATRNWSLTKGRIETGTMTEQRGRELWFLVPSFVCEIGYSYSIAGEYYSGHLLRTFYREETAKRFIDELKGKDVVVRYSVNSPSTSLLRRKDQQDLCLV